MSLDALKNSITKHNEPVQRLSELDCNFMYTYGVQKMNAFWFGNNTSTYEEAVDLTNLDTSPGYPWYYVPGCDDKADALEMCGDEIKAQVDRVIQGETLLMPFSLTLKDELRTAERVAAHKTRGFQASGFVHLLASKICFSKQNQKIVDNLGKHPITLGIAVPGAQFVSTILSLGPRAYDSDGDGWDLRFLLCLARVIREVRKAFSEDRLFDAIHHLYNSVYCGYSISLGVVYWLLHQKSGWENTSTDNSLGLWFLIILCIKRLLPNRNPDEVAKLKVNGDDLILSIDDESVGIVQVRDWLMQYNVRLEFSVSLPRDPFDITFLSHHLRERFVRGMGDIVVAAGNLPKLLSSLNWVKPSKALSFEESVVAHLLGIRLCLWPWAIEFDRVNEILDDYLSSIQISPVMRDLLKARLNDRQICQMHIKFEMRSFFFSGLDIGRSIRELLRPDNCVLSV